MTVTEQRPLFVLPAAEATLVIDEGAFAGAEVDVRLNVAYGVLHEYGRLFAAWRDAPERSPDEDAAYRSMCDLFAREGLVGWNLADHTGAIPATFDGMLRLPVDVVLTVMATWRTSIGRVMPPLRTAATSTASPSREPSPDTTSSEPTSSNASPAGDPSAPGSSETAIPSTLSLVS